MIEDENDLYPYDIKTNYFFEFSNMKFGQCIGETVYTILENKLRKYFDNKTYIILKVVENDNYDINYKFHNNYLFIYININSNIKNYIRHILKDIIYKYKNNLIE